ncbi:MAG: tRNA (guanosine(37)-N1)-methyltransferase TrmD [Bacilli bacterium]|nr:tRNA (guanosine(37)-N1)-methyltransferase TrmD [Bacilli bacterium]
MKIKILTLFPEMFTSFLNTSIIKRALSKEVFDIEVIDIRSYSLDKNKRVDDYPCGGGAGLIMRMQPVYDCLMDNKTENSYVLLTSPRGKTFNQKHAIELSKKDELIFVCGHYEGIDERFNKYCDELISIGDFILTGGEAALIPILDSIIRLLDGTITKESLSEESFDNDLLEYPQYTLPYVFNGDQIPDILFCGNHEAIRKYRLKESLRLTKTYRKDLFEKHHFSKEELKLLKEIDENNDEPKWYLDALKNGQKFIKKNVENNQK